MKITILGTGNALVTDCYNTCFVLSDGDRHFLVDGGGGNGLLTQLKAVGINWRDLRDIFLTHKHIDHLMGIIWMMRLILQHMARGDYEGEARLYGHDEIIQLLRDMADKLLGKKLTKFIDERLHLIEVDGGSCWEIISHKVTFFDIHSTKAKQFGFTMDLELGEKLTCCGDEPFNENNRQYALGSKWLLHEAFCLYSERDIFKPYEKHHSTVRDACQLAEKLQVKNLLLYHTEDKNIDNRRELYTKEGREFYTGNIFVPDDLSVIDL